MTCPKCKAATTYVIRTKQNESGSIVRRQRCCNNAQCAHRFWTEEK